MPQCVNVSFEFLGGPRDGQRVCGCLSAGVLTQAGAFYRYTDNGRVGQRFWCASEYSVAALRSLPLECLEGLESAGYRFRGHLYEIIARRESSGTLLLRVRHVGPSE